MGYIWAGQWAKEKESRVKKLYTKRNSCRHKKKEKENSISFFNLTESFI